MQHGRASGFEMPTVAGISYVVAWVCGLTLFVARPRADATDAQLGDFYHDHPWSTSMQSVLVHGVAAVALFVVAWVVWRRGVAGRWWLSAASLAAAFSIVQLGLDLWRSNGATDPAAVVHVIDRLDGVKMLALAGMVATGTASLGRRHVIGRPLQVLGWITATLAAAGGISYVAGSGAVGLAGTALVGLLAWTPCIAYRVATTAAPSSGAETEHVRT